VGSIQFRLHEYGLAKERSNSALHPPSK
jgi:hypothetical protein